MRQLRLETAPADRRHHPWRRGGKVIFDWATSLVLVVALAPLMALLALAIKLESPGPVFYRATRVGRRGRRFEMLKFRKMRDGVGGPALTSRHDPRFTRIGRFLAATKLDEIPQLFNVLRGQMSLVGPRPEDPTFVAAFPEDFAHIVSVRPGVTGLAQLAFAREAQLLRDAAEVDYVENLLPAKIEIDRLYTERHCLRLDLRILYWTLLAIAGADVAVHRRDARLSVRRRPLSLNRATAEAAT